MRTVLALAIVTVIFPLSAAGDPERLPYPSDATAATRPTEATRMVTDDCAIARRAGKTCVLDVPAEDVGGKTPVADDIAVRITRFGTSQSLIRLRRDFIPEIVRAADDL
jgi:hypothetical protein